MKTNVKYVVLSIASVIGVLSLSLGMTGFAQVADVECNGNTTVSVNQAFLLTATGGNGNYQWDGEDLDVINPTGSQFIAYYPEEGEYDITVTSNGDSDTCTITVEEGNAGTLECSPVIQTVTLGQTAAMTASGGTGEYTWSSPDLNITNPNGSGFSASFASSGFKTVTLRSGGRVAYCSVNVLPQTTVPPIVIPPVTPGFPTTGGGGM